MKSAREKILRRRILIVALCVIAIIIGIIVCVQIKKSRPDEYKKNRKQLEKLEQVDISDTEKQWEALEGANQKTEIDASKRNQYGVVELDSATLKKAFVFWSWEILSLRHWMCMGYWMRDLLFISVELLSTGLMS